MTNYSPSEGLIMDASRSRMLCPINSLKIQNTPSEFTQMSSEYNEGDILCFFQRSSAEQKDAFLGACLKSEIQLSNPPFPIDFDLESQLLGMESNQFVTKHLLSLIFTLNSIQVA